MLAGWSPARATQQVGQLQGGPDGLLLPGLRARISQLINLCPLTVMLADNIGLPTKPPYITSTSLLVDLVIWGNCG